MNVLPTSRKGTLAALLAAFTILCGGGTAGAQTGGIGQGPSGGEVGRTGFDRAGMWIWYMSASHGGRPGAIIRRARRSGIGTVYIKSGDGSDPWSQFNRPLVNRLHRGGLSVCAWQFVYGEYPRAEAMVGIGSVRKGADCLVIDAETDYEGRYAAADRYIRVLRRGIGKAYPVSLATFPWVDYHPDFPYSVFLGPGAAQYNQPQMYWNAIEVSVREVYEHSYPVNRIYERPIYPIGQTYGAISMREILAFRRFALSFGGRPESWWDWQETDLREWRTLGRDVRPVSRYRPSRLLPRLRRGSRGDMVVWAQQHLRAAGKGTLPATGLFGPLTQRAVRYFQSRRGMDVTGVIDTRTWRRLLRVEPERIAWAARARRRSKSRPAARASLPLVAPLSASLPARANELRGVPGR